MLCFGIYIFCTYTLTSSPEDSGWQQLNHPIELSNPAMTKQCLDYTHKNPVVAGFVEKAEEWLHSSAGDYYGTRKGRIELMLIE